MNVKFVKVERELSETAKEFIRNLCFLNNEYLVLAIIYSNLERSINEKFKSERP